MDLAISDQFYIAFDFQLNFQEVHSLAWYSCSTLQLGFGWTSLAVLTTVGKWVLLLLNRKVALITSPPPVLPLCFEVPVMTVIDSRCGSLPKQRPKALKNVPSAQAANGWSLSRGSHLCKHAFRAEGRLWCFIIYSMCLTRGVSKVDASSVLPAEPSVSQKHSRFLL